MSYNNVFIDSLIRIKNAQSVMYRKVDLRFSNLLISALKIMHDIGYIGKYEVHTTDNGKKSVTVQLRYYNSSPVIKTVKIFSKSGCRYFVSKGNIPTFFSGMGLTILTTSKGVMTGNNATKLGIGGELLCGIF